MNFKYHLEIAWKLTLANIVPLILMTLAMFVVSVITLGVLAPVTMAGYIHSILLLARENREPRVQDIFSQMRLFLPLLFFGIAVFLITMAGLMLLFLPGVVFALAVSFCCLYMIPLMTDRKMGLIDAVKKSFSMVTREKPVDHILVCILFVGITAVGSSVFIGTLFTQPLATLFLMSIYNELDREGKTAPVAAASRTEPVPPGGKPE